MILGGIYGSLDELGIESDEGIVTIPDEDVAFFENFIKINDCLSKVYMLGENYVFERKLFYQIHTKNTSCYECSDFENINVVGLNAAFTSYLSSSVSLVKCLESYGKQINFKANFISPMWDSVFAYRFMAQLRNYTQHKSIALTILPTYTCVFDVDRLLSTYCDWNAKVKKELLDFVSRRSADSQSVNSYLPFDILFLEYCCCIPYLVLKYFEEVEEYYYEIFRDFVDAVERNELTVKSTKGFYGDILVFRYPNEEMHAIDGYKDTPRGFSEIKLFFEEEYLFSREQWLSLKNALAERGVDVNLFFSPIFDEENPRTST